VKDRAWREGVTPFFIGRLRFAERRAAMPRGRSCAVLVDLVQVTTRDGVRLEGMYQGPATASPLGVDAFCLVHGTGGNFYSSTLFDALGERLLALGCGVLRVNTRGHDGISNAATARGGRRLGAAYETVDDCRADLAAWMDWLRQRAGPRVALVGHSLGAVKCLYAAVQEPQLAPVGLIALSPPRLSYEWFCTRPQGPEFLETYTLAEKHVSAGRPLTLLDVKLPLPFVITAAGFVEKYGPDERYNFLKFSASIPCPTLVTLGRIEVESNMAFQGTAEALEPVKARRPQLRIEMIDGADHFYTGVREALGDQVTRWLQTALA
jgi:pimeloyl-ACP methyl ester carboxylesterase